MKKQSGERLRGVPGAWFPRAEVVFDKIFSVG